MKMPNSKQGFTLVELAIVIVIIGLLVSGILFGQELINQAKIRAVASEMSSYNTAIGSFKTKYDCLPGDCRSIAVFIPGAKNGNGNGLIGDIEIVGFSSPESESSPWYQLQKANLIKGSFKAQSNCSDNVGDINTNKNGEYMPLSKFPKHQYSYRLNFSYSPNNVPANTRNSLQLVTGYNTYSCHNPSEASPVEAKELDEKIDDGIASSGQLMTGSMNANNCIDANGDYIANKTKKNSICYIHYWVDF